jgi:uroporphyrin-3 C-methyltransferase
MPMSAADNNAATSDSGDSAAAAKDSQSAASRPGNALAWLALLVAAAALAAAGFAALQLNGLQTAVVQSSEGASGRIERLGGELTARVDKLVRQSAEQSQAVADLQIAVEQTISSVTDLPQRVAQVENQLASVPGISAGSRNAFLQSEALYYMRIANAQATLAAAPGIAANALQLADDKLREAGNPALVAVRRQLGADIAALRAVPEVDRAGISFRLQALAAEVYNWPFRYGVPERFGNERAPAADDPGLSAWERLQALVKGVAASIVSVREVDAAPEAQLAAVEQAIIVETVRAELQLARLALLDNNVELYQQALARVAEQSGRYFDTGASAVAAALQQLAELAELELPGPLPDASGSLQLMLAFTAAPAPAAAPAAAPPDSAAPAVGEQP